MYGHRYTQEEKDFLGVYIPGHTYREIQAAFTDKFGWDITLGQVKGYMANHRINNGLTGRFGKGHIPQNKGKKGQCASGCEKTWFAPGHTPTNHRPIGSERISKDGYVEVKVAEPNKWRLKHRVVWEETHGTVPKGKIIVFRDGDKTNTEINNLMLLSRGQNAVMNHTGLYKYSGELKDTAVMLADIKIAANRARKKR